MGKPAPKKPLKCKRCRGSGRLGRKGAYPSCPACDGQGVTESFYDDWQRDDTDADFGLGYMQGRGAS